MPQNVAAQGGKGGVVWDDGLQYRIKKLFVGRDDACVTFVKFEYDNRNGTVESRKHGTKNQKPQRGT